MTVVPTFICGARARLADHRIGGGDGDAHVDPGLAQGELEVAVLAQLQDDVRQRLGGEPGQARGDGVGAADPGEEDVEPAVNAGEDLEDGSGRDMHGLDRRARKPLALGVDDHAAEGGGGHALGEDQPGQNQTTQEDRNEQFFHGNASST